MQDNIDNKNHWETVFTAKASNEVSWFQTFPKTSVDFIEEANLPLDANIIDVGAGDSHLVDALLERGYQNIYVLDISANALERAKKRLGDKAKKVNWIVSDITEFKPTVQFDLWHDRAAFHFLTADDKIEKYVSIVEGSIRESGHFILGTFSESGPLKCSNLDIQQYNESTMTQRFEKSFTKVKCITEDHATPSGKTQNFLFCHFRKK